MVIHKIIKEIIILVGINLASFLLNPILMSTVITIAVLPLTGWFRNKGLPGWPQPGKVCVKRKGYVWKTFPGNAIARQPTPTNPALPGGVFAWA